MLFTITLVVIALLLGMILFMPITLCIDTDKELYYLRLKGLFKMSMEADKMEVIRIRVHTVFKDFYYYPLRKKKSRKKKSKKIKLKRKKRFSMTKILRVLKSFKLRKFNLDIDTSNCITNARLYPLFAFLNHKYGGFNINYEGRIKVLIYIENKPLRLLRSFINI